MAQRADRSPDSAARQQPAVLGGSRVVLLISKGPTTSQSPVFVGVPDVVSKSQGEALSDLQSSGLSARVFDEPHEKVAHGHVIAQTPEAGQTALTDAEIVLLVSSGRPVERRGFVTLPNVAGMPEADAISEIRDAGLSALTVHDFSATVPSGIVIDQIPNAASVGAHVRRPPVWLWVLLALIAVVAIAAGAFALFSRVAAVPNVTRLTQQQAQAGIVAAGFKVGSVSTTQSARAEDVGRVVDQTPAPGTQSRVGSAVDIVVVGGLSLVPVPDLSGMTQAAAQAALDNAGFVAAIEPGNSASVPKGQVMGQAPQPGAMVPAGTSVGVTISQGPAAVPVPDVVGKTEGEATTLLRNSGLKVAVVTNNNPAPDGEVYSQAPVQGTLVAPGSTVSILVSSGPAPAAETEQVPDVIGKTRSQATDELRELGFKVAVTQIAGGTEGQVVGQAPAADAFEPKGSTITILVSTGSGP